MFELSEFMQEFVTEPEAKGLTLRLVFKIFVIPPNQNIMQYGGSLSNWFKSVYLLVHAKVKIFC